jgi:hypothetical protein
MNQSSSTDDQGTGNARAGDEPVSGFGEGQAALVAQEADLAASLAGLSQLSAGRIGLQVLMALV